MKNYLSDRATRSMFDALWSYVKQCDCFELIVNGDDTPLIRVYLEDHITVDHDQMRIKFCGCNFARDPIAGSGDYDMAMLRSLDRIDGKQSVFLRILNSETGDYACESKLGTSYEIYRMITTGDSITISPFDFFMGAA